MDNCVYIPTRSWEDFAKFLVSSWQGVSRMLARSTSKSCVRSYFNKNEDRILKDLTKACGLYFSFFSQMIVLKSLNNY